MAKRVRLILEFVFTMVIPGLYLINLMLLVMYPNTVRLSLWLVIIGLLIGVAGLGIWGASYWAIGNAFGVLPKKQKRVNTGLYRWFKHPMYVGITSAFVGLSIASMSLPGLCFSGLVLIPILVLRAYREEKLLY